MCDKYPRWDITDFLNTEKRACLYLKAALDDDTGNGDTLRLAWQDIHKAYEAGRVAINAAMDKEEMALTLAKYGLCEAAIRKITSASQSGPIVNR